MRLPLSRGCEINGIVLLNAGFLTEGDAIEKISLQSVTKQGDGAPAAQFGPELVQPARATVIVAACRHPHHHYRQHRPRIVAAAEFSA